MPKSNLDAVIGRALRDEEFRKRMLADPDATGAEYGLSGLELSQLKSVSQEAADEFFNKVSGGAGATAQNCWTMLCN